MIIFGYSECDVQGEACSPDDLIEILRQVCAWRSLYRRCLKYTNGTHPSLLRGMSRSGPAVATVSTHVSSPSHTSWGVNGLRLAACGTQWHSCAHGLCVCVGPSVVLRRSPQVDDNFDGMIDLAEW